MVYLPTREDGDGVKWAEVRHLSDGRRALLAYTALDRLVSCCGQRQPWSLVAAARLEAVHDEQPFDVVALDIEIPVSMRAQGWLS